MTQTPGAGTPPPVPGQTPARADGPPLPEQPWRATTSPTSLPPAVPGAAGTAVPETGAGSYVPAPVRDRSQTPVAATPPVAAGPAPVVASTTQAAAEQDPAGGVPDADSALLAGQKGYSGADWRKQVAKATSRQYAAQRGDKGRRRKAAGKTTGTGYVPGGNRRNPSQRGEGGGAS
jgi:hypothetical protein